MSTTHGLKVINFVQFSVKISNLVAEILMIFPKLYQPEKSQPKQIFLFLVR